MYFHSFSVQLINKFKYPLFDIYIFLREISVPSSCFSHKRFKIQIFFRVVARAIMKNNSFSCWILMDIHIPKTMEQRKPINIFLFHNDFPNKTIFMRRHALTHNKIQLTIEILQHTKSHLQIQHPLLRLCLCEQSSVSIVNIFILFLFLTTHINKQEHAEC